MLEELNATLVFGLEDVNSFGKLLATFLSENGYVVKHVYSTLANIVRVSQATYHKTDEYDAYCVAHILKDMETKLPTATFNIKIDNLAMLLNQRQLLNRNKAKMYLSLHNNLMYVYPRYNQFFSQLQTKSAKHFFLTYPHPLTLKGVSAEILTAKIKESAKNFTIKKAEKILTIVAEDNITVEDNINSFVLQQTIITINTLEEQIKLFDDRIDLLLEELPYKLTTIPGVNTITAAVIIANIGDIKRFKTEKSLARFAGIAPVTIASSSTTKIESSRGGNRELRSTLYFLAVGMITYRGDTKRNKRFYDYYHKKIGEGKTTTQALICIMRQLVRIIYSMMKYETEYEER